MNTTYAAIKTYAGIPLRFHGAKCDDGSDPVWDEGLQQNTCPSKRAYSADDAKPRVYAAGDELDERARQRMTMFPGETYRQAFKQVLADNPELRAAYASIK
ncbi:MAG: hypothetical protein WA146_15560 [Thiobacillus sp.]